jgi:hypothetical protein
MGRLNCSGSTVQTVGNGIAFVLTKDRDVDVSGQILAKQTVGVLARQVLCLACETAEPKVASLDLSGIDRLTLFQFSA